MIRLDGLAFAAGVGLGLFGVLSIIRLRSTELEQNQVAYYFSALACGLLAGLAAPSAISVGLTAMILVVIFAGDHPRLFPGVTATRLSCRTRHSRSKPR